MSDTHNKLQYGNNYNHWNGLKSVLELNCFSFCNPIWHAYVNTKP